MPKPLSQRVHVRHTTSGAQKYVLRSQLQQVLTGGHWERVPVVERIKKRPARPKPQPVEETTPTETPASAADKED